MVDGLLGFNNSLANNPTASELAKGLAEAVRNGTVKLPIDPTTIVVTDSSGVAGQYTFMFSCNDLYVSINVTALAALIIFLDK